MIAVASHNHPCNILSYIVNIALHCCHKHLSCSASSAILLLDKRLQNSHSLFHCSCSLNNLRQKQFTCTKKFADVSHSIHQRPRDNINGSAIFCNSLVKVFLQIVTHTFQKSTLKTLLNRCSSPSIIAVMNCRCTFLFQAGSNLNETLGSIGTAVKNNILHHLAHIRRDILIQHRALRVYNSHIHSGCYCVIQEHRVQCLAHIVITSERE